MIPGLKGLHTHELAHKCVYDFGSRSDMSMKVGKHIFYADRKRCLLNRKGAEDMNTIELLDKLQRQAMSDEKLRKELLETRKAKNPLGAFCKKCRELGYEIYEMELVTAGEEFYAEMKRSTNGGGENSPKLEGEDDFYEMFLASMEEEEEHEQSKEK